MVSGSWTDEETQIDHLKILENFEFRMDTFDIFEIMGFGLYLVNPDRMDFIIIIV